MPGAGTNTWLVLAFNPKLGMCLMDVLVNAGMHTFTHGKLALQLRL